MPSHIKTYDESEDPEDHLKIIHAATKVEHWAMPAWCHMFNYILIGSSKKNALKIPWKSTTSSREKESLQRNLCAGSRLKVGCEGSTGSHENLRIHAWNYKP
ncbi:hypothetical protein Tco_0899369 [Tanacetum coccineum]